MKNSILFILVITLVACKCKKNIPSTTSDSTSTITNPSHKTNPKQNTESNSTSEKSNLVRYSVAFTSIGAGIDGKINDEFVKFINTYSTKIDYTSFSNGREGEITYCIPLSEMSSTEQKEFIKKANIILSKSILVFQNENVKCSDPSQENSPKNFERYRLVVSFFSIGEGIDGKTKAEFENFLNNYPKKINYHPSHWGREGETDYCLLLSELSSEEQASFISQAKELLSNSNKIHISENSECVHNR